MLALLMKGRQAGTGGYYVHTGDLSWWLYYTEPGRALWQYIYLWEGAQGEGELDGWALLSPQWAAFDVFVRPELRGSLYAEAMVSFAEERIAEIVRQGGGSEISTIWVGEGDDVLIPYLERRGFHRGESFMQLYQCTIPCPLETPALPAGFKLGYVNSEAVASSRAAASQAAFGSDWDSQRYLRRYLNFRCSPVYQPQQDIVVLDPDGRVAAFCLFWLDGINQVGLFEPVGTHPHFQRMGLGKAVLLDGMRRMAECGMNSAIVSALSEEDAANRLYRAAGMQPSIRLLTFLKAV